MAVELARIDLTKLDAALVATAKVIRDAYGVLAETTGASEYGTLAAAQYAFDLANETGLATPFYSLISNIYEEMNNLGSGGGSCATDITNIFSAAKAGSFTVPSDVGGTEGDTYTITHNLGVVPDIVFVWTPDLPIKYRDSTGTSNTLIYALWINNQEGTTDNYKNFVLKVSTTTYPGQYSGNQYQVAFRGNTPTSTAAVLNLTTSILQAKKHVGTAEESVVRYVWIAAKLATAGGGS